LHLSNGKCGGLGGANEKQIPKTIVRLEENLEETLKETLEETPKTVAKCGEPSCQFNMEMKDEGDEEPHVCGPQEAGADPPAGGVWEGPERGRQ
jgi:hypothetical protein